MTSKFEMHALEMHAPMTGFRYEHGFLFFLEFRVFLKLLRFSLAATTRTPRKYCYGDFSGIRAVSFSFSLRCLK